MTYRSPSIAPRGRWARWLHEMRIARDWSQQQAFEALRVGLGLGPKSRASYIAIDMGPRPPNVRQQEFLVKFFGQSPDDMPTAPEPLDDAITPAVRELVEALNDLVAELRLTRAEQLVTQEQMQEALQRADGLSRASSRPTRRPRPVAER